MSDGFDEAGIYVLGNLKTICVVLLIEKMSVTDSKFIKMAGAAAITGAALLSVSFEESAAQTVGNRASAGDYTEIDLNQKVSPQEGLKIFEEEKTKSVGQYPIFAVQFHDNCHKACSDFFKGVTKHMLTSGKKTVVLFVDQTYHPDIDPKSTSFKVAGKEFKYGPLLTALVDGIQVKSYKTDIPFTYETTVNGKAEIKTQVVRFSGLADYVPNANEEQRKALLPGRLHEYYKHVQNVFDNMHPPGGAR